MLSQHKASFGINLKTWLAKTGSFGLRQCFGVRYWRDFAGSELGLLRWLILLLIYYHPLIFPIYYRLKAKLYGRVLSSPGPGLLLRKSQASDHCSPAVA